MNFILPKVVIFHKKLFISLENFKLLLFVEFQELIDGTKRKRAERINQQAESFVKAFLDEIENNHGKQSWFTGKIVVCCTDLVE